MQKAAPANGSKDGSMRLWLRFFLSFALLSTLGLLAVVWWQQQAFSRGFKAYLEAAMRVRAEQVAGVLAEDFQLHGDWEWLRRDPMLFGRYARNGAPPDGRAPPPAMDGAGAPPPHQAHGPPPGAAGQPPPMQAWGDTRWALHDAEGNYVAGRGGLDSSAVSVAVASGSRVFGELRIAPPDALPMGAEQDFLRSQWRHGLLAAGVVLILSLLLSFALARQLSRPLAMLGAAARALADGDYSQRACVARHDELGKLAEQFNRMAEALERHRKERQRWGADIAHELRTPLTILQTELQLLREGIRPLTTEAVESLISEGNRLSALIEDLYQLSLADAGELQCELRAEDLCEWLRERAASWQGTAQAYGHRFQMHCPQQPVWAAIDERRFAQALDNLFLNACRYTDVPGTIELQLWTDSAGVHVQWQDSTPGVAEVDLPKLFDRLFRGERSRNRASGGSGLGLSIVEAIIRAHHGTVQARPATLGGLCMHIQLPAMVAPT